MKGSIAYWIMLVFVMQLSAATAYAQIDRKEVRSGNRDFRKNEWREAEVDYMKALVKDSMSFAANYNLASALYRQEEFEKAKEALGKIEQAASVSPYASDYYYNLGDVAIALGDWQAAVDAFGRSLLLNPGDIDAKENFIYARKMLQNQMQNGGGDGNSGDNSDENNEGNDKSNGGNNKDNDGNDDKDKDNNDGDDRKDDRNGDNDDGKGDDGKGDDGRGDDGRDSGNGQSQLTPQAAQQMLQAIQAKEKETQEKVKKAKAAAARSRQKEKNW